jgi:hypothetical protein
MRAPVCQRPDAAKSPVMFAEAIDCTERSGEIGCYYSLHNKAA